MSMIRQRMLRWALRRQGPDRLPLQLKPRRIYILPTRTGWVFGLLVIAMFLAGMNYGNGLALLLTFWLASFALVGMIQTQRGLANLAVQGATAEPAFAGGEVALTLQLRLQLPPQDLLFSAEGTMLQSQAVAGQGGHGEASVTLRFRAQRRGAWRAPVLRLATSAPYGLFRTWTWLSLDVRSLVYPRPQGNRPLPELPGQAPGSRRLAGSVDEFAALRPFREWDSPRQVAWKAYARGAPLLVREYQGHAAALREFDFEAVPLQDTEARLSQLSRWIVDAAAENQRWTLRLPGTAALEGAGPEHRRQCLARLALFGTEAAT
ncbi:MAG TPA: DUF58 domain-containing protein [Steroidobacteraceae bacterium]|nr:DUF58 domain-containing protein [Steroidobacteraceae bacterium]